MTKASLGLLAVTTHVFFISTAAMRSGEIFKLDRTKPKGFSVGVFKGALPVGSGVLTLYVSILISFLLKAVSFYYFSAENCIALVLSLMGSLSVKPRRAKV